ncbi:MAG: FTR1 family iron permease [Candidatus Omnitrophica bacterium]|nr:FTR1 family iron permease [Candidatus Omnitrophota bacterium]
MGGEVFSTFVVVFREALEAGLIVGILLSVLGKLGASRYEKHVWGSVLAALAASVLAGWALAGFTDSVQDQAQKIIEGVISLLAAGVLTTMFFWMEKQGRRIKSDLEARVETALSKKDDVAIVSLAFFAVFREGVETVLFLKAVAIQNGGAVSWQGGLTGLGLAFLISLAIFAGGQKVPLRLLFRLTGVLILLMAAGLLAYGVHELEEARWIPSFIYPLYNINSVLNEKTGVGSFLKALFGYNGNPSLTETIVYWFYWAAMGWHLFRQKTVVREAA